MGIEFRSFSMSFKKHLARTSKALRESEAFLSVSETSLDDELSSSSILYVL